VALTQKQLQIYNQLVRDGASNAQIAKRFGVDESDVTSFLEDNNLTAPSETLLRDKPLGPNAQNKYNEAVNNRTSVADLAAQYGISEEQANRFLAERNLQDPGNPLDKTSKADNAVAKSQLAVDDDGVYTLNDWQQGIYYSAKARGLTAHDLASDARSRGILGITEDKINTLLGNAGLNLDSRAPFTQEETSIPNTVNNPGKDGLPPDVDGLGIYGDAGKDNTPAGISGRVPRNPMLASVFRHARRTKSPGYRGQTDTILTGGQGLTDKPMTDRKTLLGS
jgi:transposase-like protein